jgi:sugar/nucleoside kinase (ribokinase family)
MYFPRSKREMLAVVEPDSACRVEPNDLCMQVVQVPAIGESNAVDATGAGDLFASGFLYGLVKGLPLEECCKVGACSGGSVIRALGGEVRPENWQWMYKQMHAGGLLLRELKN